MAKAAATTMAKAAANDEASAQFVATVPSLEATTAVAASAAASRTTSCGGVRAAHCS